MNDEERRIITQYVERVAGAAPAQTAPSSPWGGMGGSVPQTQARPNLPPVDRDADALISDLFARYPEARYRITQTAFVQEAALVEAQNRIRQLEWEVENARGQAQAAQQQKGGLFGGMFGGGARPQPRMAPPPQPVYPPGYNPGMLQQGRGGSGFLGTAVMTAAGVAGGMVLGNMLMNAFSGHGGAAQAASFDGGAGGFGQEAVPTSSPWTDPGTAAADQGWGGGGQDATGSYDQASGYDSGAAGYDDAGGGGYDDEDV
ncbi:DUF2076 domain-containing protein [Paracraurococcus ruber]|uniref:DUF2076 domain-containing protein n=1 Tax=Paracraurococcus ruber TaxID=77675 RepID=A0ABS1CSR8_9PROT|nr:DUF2076 family protein [Paracraurococcus ruber]MBK1657521.1 hypothetical protein [Paracraurococcus ruber]TDG34073.1 DUF2076 domain-containing protein [Paracraurococcus ruber]